MGTSQGTRQRARLVFSRGFLTLPRRPSISLGHHRPLLLLTTATYLPKPLPTPPTDRSTTALLLPLPHSRSRSRARHPPLCPTPTHRPPHRPSPSIYAPLPAHLVRVCDPRSQRILWPSSSSRPIYDPGQTSCPCCVDRQRSEPRRQAQMHL
jgi:hypothetical protein